MSMGIPEATAGAVALRMVIAVGGVVAVAAGIEGLARLKDWIRLQGERDNQRRYVGSRKG